MSSRSLLATANPPQRAAITTTDGPLLIIADPGSGKTFTLATFTLSPYLGVPL